ncbi:hypothetical protein LMUR_07379 [Listeria grayi FSL F6-1183]|uniref:Uncharacterized protein n=1 Tax=Listeria grayi FSL F6-1183 TaxID=1265827 RepID=A0A829R965_LISGR|nr:hypothetical protein LMUR_07379 [Listeria grayi FSL F6-1183]
MNKTIIFYVIYTILAVVLIISFALDWIASWVFSSSVLCLVILNIGFRLFMKRHQKNEDNY